MPFVMFMIVCLLWGTNFILMKKLTWPIGAFGPISVGASRMLGGAALLSVIWFIAQRRSGTRWPFGWRAWPRIVLLATIGMGLPYVIQPYLIAKHADSAFFGMMVAWIPLLTILVSVPILKVWPSGRQVAGVLLGLGCMLILLGAGQVKGIAWPDLLLAASVPTGYAISNAFIKRWYTHVSPLALTMLLFLSAGLVILPASVMTETVQHNSPTQLATLIVALAWLSFLGTGVATYLFYRLVTTRGPLWAGMVTYVIPLGALMWGWLDGETIGPGQLLALVGIFLALGLVQGSGQSKRQRTGQGQAEVAADELEMFEA